MKNEPAYFRSQIDYRSQQVFEVFQSIETIYMGQTQIIFPNFYTRVTAVARHM